ncbi:MAG: CARDB domain-containing protein [Candidatus Paceibacterota bacterium]
MNKNIFALTLFFACALLIPSMTHAAFSLTPVSQNGDGKGYSTTNPPVYVEQMFNIYGGYAPDYRSTQLQACNTALQRSGLSDTVDTYCVYDGKEMFIPNSWGCFDSSAAANCNIPAYGPNPTGPADSPVGSWSVSQTDIVKGYYPNITISIYQSPLQQQSLAAMQTALGFAMNNMFCDFGSCPNGRMPDPGYRDVCPNAHDDEPGRFILFTGPAFACNIYHHDGVIAAKPVASLTASPSTIVSGNSSLLTYSCSNGATSASIDNGVGTKTPAASGSAPVSPTTTTTYTLTCTNSGGSSTATATVTVEPVLTASCSVSPSSMTTAGTASWTAVPAGGNGTYGYSWTGDDGLSGSAISVNKTYSTAGTKTGSVTVTSGTQSVTQACANNVTVAVVAQPDLTAGNVSVVAATANIPVTLSAIIANSPAAATGATFTDLFQRATDSSGTGSTDIGTYSSAALAAGGSNTASLSYAFPSAGTWYVRACADKSSAGSAGVIAESNEGNNCSSSWTAITVAPATLSCTVSPSSVTIPGSVTYTASGASAPYTWTPSDGVGSYGTANTASRNFTTAGNYGMTVSKAGYTNGSCPVVAAGTASCTGTAVSITATPNRIRPGQTSTLSYTASGVSTSCSITGPGVSQNIAGNSCSIPAPTPISTPALSTQATYTITCDGTVSSSAIVNVIPAFQEF